MKNYSRYYINVDDLRKVVSRIDSTVSTIDISEFSIPVTVETFKKTLEKNPGVPYLMEDGSVEYRSSDPLDAYEREAVNEQSWRNNAIDSITWLRDRHRDELDLGSPTTLSEDEFARLLSSIKSLRDWPQSLDFPNRQLRPDIGEWESHQ